MFLRKILTFMLVVLISMVSVFADHNQIHTNQQLIENNISTIARDPIGAEIVRDFNINHKNTRSPDLPENATYQDAFDRGLFRDQVGGPITSSAIQNINQEISGQLDDLPPSESFDNGSTYDEVPESLNKNNSSSDSPCQFDIDAGDINISNALDNCLKDSKLVSAEGSIKVEEGMKDMILSWTLSLAQLLGLLAVGAIVYGGLLMTLSGGEEERIKKGKDVVKWAIVGFLGVLFAGVLVRLVVEVIFGIANITS